MKTVVSYLCEVIVIVVAISVFATFFVSAIKFLL